MQGAATHLAVVVVACLLRGAAIAQGSEPKQARHLEHRSGLSHNTVFAIEQDRQGFLWIGTADGLNRFDGYEYVVYRHNPRDSTSLSHNVARALMLDGQGDLWVGTETSVDRLDRARGQFVRHRIEPFGEHLSAIQLLEEANGRIYVVAVGAVVLFDPGTGDSRFFAPAEGTDLDGGFTGGALDSSGTLWLSVGERSTAGLYRLSPGEESLEFVPAPPDWGWGSLIHHAPQGGFWSGSTDVVGRFTPSTLAFERFYQVGGILRLVDSSGNLWVERSGKILQHDSTGHLLASFVTAEDNYLATTVRTAFEDRAGGLWFGTLGGLYYHDPYGKRFDHRRRDTREPNSLGGSVVTAVLRATDGTLWVGSLGGGMDAFRPDGSIRRFRNQPANPQSLPNDNVWAIAEDAGGHIWVGTDAGLAVVDPRGPTGVRRIGSIPSRPVYVITPADEDRFWIGGLGLYRLDPADGTVEKPGAWRPSGLVEALYEDHYGMLWIGTPFQGLFRLDTASGTVQGYPTATEHGDGVPGKMVQFIHPDRRDASVLWLATDLALVRFDVDVGTFTPFFPSDGLPGSQVYGILQDDSGDLWIGTNQGLARFERDERRFRSFDAADGTGSTEFNRRAVHVDRDGRFYFGGMQGLTIFHPEEIKDHPYRPPVVITQLQRANRDGSETIVHDQFPAGGIVLSYRDYTFSFGFAALHYARPERTRYAYLLEGFDSDWIEVGTRRYAGYTNVPPGRYVFRVRAANHDGIWGDTEAALEVTILPPIWQTWWFRALVIAIVLALVGVLYRLRVAHLVGIERMRLRIAGDLHDDIGSKMSSIALMGEMVAARTVLDEPERLQLQEITNASRKLVGDLRDIVWMVNPEYDHVENLVSKMQHVAASMLNGISHTFKDGTGGRTDEVEMHRRRQIFLMYQEALHNVLRHSGASHVDIHVELSSGTLLVEIRDDGSGFDPQLVSGGEGLRNLEKRAKMAKAALEIATRPGHGTCISVRAPIA